MGTESIPEPPPGLSVAGGALWAELHEAYEEFSPHEAALLHQACRIADNMVALSAVVDREGPLIESDMSGAPRAHPALVELRAQQITQARLFAAMRLPDSDGLRPQHRQARGTYVSKRMRQLRGA